MEPKDTGVGVDWICLVKDRYKFWTLVNTIKNWYSGVWSPIGSTRHCGQQ
jgi:hypothetical protein